MTPGKTEDTVPIPIMKKIFIRYFAQDATCAKETQERFGKKLTLLLTETLQVHYSECTVKKRFHHWSRQE